MLPPFWIKNRGRWGEYLARRRYHRRGFHCLAKNWRYESGEIDIIMANPRQVVFLEVKTRKYRPQMRMGDTLSFGQKKRLLRLARVYLNQWPDQNIAWSFRLVLVSFGRNRKTSIHEADVA